MEIILNIKKGGFSIMANNQKATKKFTAEEESKIQSEVIAMQEKQRQAEIEAEIRDRALNAQRQKPGYRYY